jgi:hypothetical protein
MYLGGMQAGILLSKQPCQEFFNRKRKTNTEKKTEGRK